MNAIAVEVGWGQRGVCTLPLLERPVDSANLMIRRAKYLPRQIRFCCRARVWNSIGTRMALFYRVDSRASAREAVVCTYEFCGGSKLRLTIGAGGHQTLPREIKANWAMFRYRPQMTPAVDRAPHTFREDSQSRASYSSPPCRAFDEMVRHELTAVPVNIVAQPGVQCLEFATGDFAGDVGMRLQRRRIKLRR